jgi:glucokinase
MNKKTLAIGADVGGSHISCAAIDLTNKRILRNTFTDNKVNNLGTREDILDSWASALRKCLAKIPAESLGGIGFAMPGPFEYTTGIAKFKGLNSKYQHLYDVNIETSLKELLHLDKSLPIRFMNDASAFAVGEAWMGKSAAYSRSLAITLGTGFGSAFIENGLPVVIGEKVPENGCVWHLKYLDDIADSYISTRWFTKTYKKTTGRDIDGVKELAGLATDDPVARSMFEEYGTNLAIILSPWIKKFGVEIIVAGGNISGAYPLFGPHFENRMMQDGLDPDVELSQLKEDAAMIGSARLLEEDFWKRIKPIIAHM